MAIVKYNAKNVYSCLDIRLLPGVNQVENSQLERVLLEPLFKHRVDEGIIVIIPEIQDPKDEKAKDKQLVQLMCDVYDVKLLKKYIKESKDKEIVKSAKKQLKKIEDVPVKEVEKEVGFTIK